MSGSAAEECRYDLIGPSSSYASTWPSLKFLCLKRCDEEAHSMINANVQHQHRYLACMYHLPSDGILTNWAATCQKAGAIAAFTVDFVVYPLDTLKTRIQSPRYKELYADAATGAVQRRLLFRGLYQGIWSVVIATIPSCKFQLSCYLHFS